MDVTLHCQLAMVGDDSESSSGRGRENRDIARFLVSTELIINIFQIRFAETGDTALTEPLENDNDEPLVGTHAQGGKASASNVWLDLEGLPSTFLQFE